MLKELFSDYSNAKLIEIIELPDAYTEEAIETAQACLKSRNLLPSSCQNLSREFWKPYIIKHFKLILNKKLQLKSNYLDQDEMKALYQEALTYYNERQELFEIDLTKYWGAAL